MNKVKVMFIKVSISILSLLFFIIILEIGLRLAGHIYSLVRQGNYSNRDSITGKGDIRTRKENNIVCLGESYTFGGGVKFNETYPSYLHGMLNSRNTNTHFNVINRGRCEVTTRYVLFRLPEIIRSDKPNIIVLLAGSANTYNLIPYDLQTFGIDDVIGNLRVHKIAQIIYFNLKNIILNSRLRIIKLNTDDLKTEIFDPKADLIGNYPPTRWDLISEHIKIMSGIKASSGKLNTYENIWLVYNNGDTGKALQLCKDTVKTDPMAPLEIRCMLAYLYYKSGNVNEAIRLYNLLLKDNPNSEFVLSHAAFFYSQLGEQYWQEKIKLRLSFLYNRLQDKKLSAKSRYDLAIVFICRAIELDPTEKANYYMLAKAYELQTRYTANDILGIFREMSKQNPNLMKNKLFLNYFIFFRNKHDWEKKICKWMYHDLEEIVKICKENNIMLIVQNYPYPYAMANATLRSIASEYSLPLVDNYFLFSKLVKEATWEKYFLDDDHCTPEGYRAIAENIYNKLVTESIVTEY